MRELVKCKSGQKDHELAKEFARIISEDTATPDMALCGRMLEPKKAKKNTSEASTFTIWARDTASQRSVSSFPPTCATASIFRRTIK